VRSGAIRYGLAAVSALALTAGCGGQSPTAGANGAARAGAQGSKTSNAVGAGASSSAAPAASTHGAVAPGSTSPAGANGTAGVAGSAGTKPGGTTAPTTTAAPAQQGTAPPVATAEEIPIHAVVSPGCVLAGGTATLRVTSVPKAFLGYVAMYAGEKSGAQPPFGYGYGGNDKGETNADGAWVGTWVVRADAPVGRGRVVIVVAHEGKQREIDVPLSVGAREANGCGTS
jgi:hypothetical protein